MKKYIQNLLVPFAVLAMLTVGAFTINASEKTDKTVNVETVMEPQASNPYSGDIYIRTPNPSGPGFIFTKVGEIQEGDCGLEIGVDKCTMRVGGENHELWAEVTPNNYVPLYKLED
ncbi:hypothetical protein [Myroides marinus]|uniref:hypothetical protein n=1 Tax=Myroides marinus TaxID=703342 RepID=UPI0025771BD6|nr:hypothetical protein [Myroides marinus]MDM1354810.1 hypothetical protein [Myroides marinus]MDM1534377.1 hypothetical protein [Myroides marinus]MDM1541339.1 hypothetical protein [Myroides marinus]